MKKKCIVIIFLGMKFLLYHKTKNSLKQYFSMHIVRCLKIAFNQDVLIR